MRANSITLLCVMLIGLSSCHKEQNVITAPTTHGVYITNEGDFNSGQGEISFYDPISRHISNNLFYAVNHYHPGDVVQSMYIKDSTGFIVVNNSSKVEVVKIPSLQHIITITIPNSSPRYFLPVSDSIAYVTDLYASQIHVINYRTGRLVSNITGVAEWTEHLTLAGNTVIVEERSLLSTPASQGSIVAINPTSHTVVGRYSFNGSNIDGIVTDHLNRIWLAIDADTLHHVPSSIYNLNTDLTVNRHLLLSTGNTAYNLKVNGNGDEIYYFDNNGIKAISINDSTLPAAPLIPGMGRNLYGLGIDPGNGDIYVSDAIDYVQRSRIYRYDKTAFLIQSDTAGVISGNFAFNKQ